MSTSTEDKTEVIPDWAAGYGIPLPCGKKDCNNEADWFGNQHECIRAYVCDPHMQRIYASVNRDLADWGAIECRFCHEVFITFDSFIKAVRI